MGSPPKHKSLQKGAKVPWRLHFQNLRMAFFHGHLRKVRVGQKVHRKTELFCDKIRIDDFGEMSRFFYVTDVAADLRFELVNTRQRKRLRLSTSISCRLPAQGRILTKMKSSWGPSVFMISKSNGQSRGGQTPFYYFLASFISSSLCIPQNHDLGRRSPNRVLN